MSYTPPKLPFSFPLFKGMRGPSVTDLQNWLDDLSFYYPLMPADQPELNTTGEFDELTKSYVKGFQKFCGLPQTGVYSKETHEYMEWKFDNYMLNEGVRMKRLQDEATKKAEAAKKQKMAPKMAPKVPTKNSADLFSTRHWK